MQRKALYFCLHRLNYFFIIDKMINPNFYEEMNKTYLTINHWPQPYAYMQWFQALEPDYQAYYMHPDIYNVNYEYSVRRFQEQMKPNKPSRSQKRAIKKKQLQEQLEKERKEIGNWVNLQRKDLIQGLQRIEQKEKKLKQKKKQKYSHLIEIHKQVYKHYLKKGSNDPPNRRVNIASKKKRLSYIKKMKYVYQKNVNSKEIENHDEEWESEEQGQSGDENEKAAKIVQKKQKNEINISIDELQKIKYMQMGKLTGKSHHNVILREWVRNVPTEALQDITLKLINRLAYKQAVRKVQKPTKVKKLIVSGIKQCKRTIETIIDKNRSKVLIIALNIERNPLKKGVDDQVQNVIKNALKINIPIVHISTRAKLGRAFTGKFGPRITMVSIVNFEGYQDMMENLINEWKIACGMYNTL